MSSTSSIEWTNATWNPLTGCTLVSEGCRNCYAAKEAAGRLSHLPQYKGLAVRRGGRAVFTGEVRLHEDRLDQPLRWRKPRMVFVNSMSDLFHESVPFEFIDKVFAVMAFAKQHTFQILTKRPERMAAYLNTSGVRTRVERAAAPYVKRFGTIADQRSYRLAEDALAHSVARTWPLPNVWLGTSVEDQAAAVKRIPHLLWTPAAIRFLSCEPLLGPVDLGDRLKYRRIEGSDLFATFDTPGYQGRLTEEKGIHWVIVGGESGPNARPMHPDWARALRDQCQAAGVAYFFKQFGEWVDEFHPSLTKHVSEYPLDDRFADFTEDGQDYRGVYMARVGKKAAGRELDGRTWDELPQVAP